MNDEKTLQLILEQIYTATHYGFALGSFGFGVLIGIVCAYIFIRTWVRGI